MPFKIKSSVKIAICSVDFLHAAFDPVLNGTDTAGNDKGRNAASVSGSLEYFEIQPAF